MAMEGKAAACAHLSPVGNVAGVRMRYVVERVGAERQAARCDGACRVDGTAHLRLRFSIAHSPMGSASTAKVDDRLRCRAGSAGVHSDAGFSVRMLR